MQQLLEQSSNKLPSVSTISGGAAKVELPFYSKYLLIAAYLASYNPAKSDRRFFLKHHGKQKKTQAMMKAKERSCSQLTGPKQFPLDRLLAIFYSISECKQAPTAALMMQLSTLVSLRLVVQVGADEAIDAPKFKCAVGLHFIRQIARTVDFDVVHYLYDFA
ncbi:Origin recognition complex subunit 5 [Trinorchestia longiramus]|nr:Origin recognition complex subunit 5 [Trinorchestia longiramus]